MMRREALTRLREGDGRNDRGHDGNRNANMHIELEPADHEEPTWEVRPAQPPGRRRRLDPRTRIILGVAAVLAVVVNAGAALAYWQITDTEVAQAAAGPPVQMSLRARSDLNKALQPGSTGDLIVTVTNDNDFPIRITSMTGSGPVVADPEHETRGCAAPGVRLIKPSFDVRWEVGRNSIGVYNVPGGLTMRRGASAACKGATFTVPVRVSGVRTDG